MKEDTIHALDREFMEDPITAAGPVPQAEIDTLETQVGFPLPADYKEFVARYGGAVVGPFSIFGLRHVPTMASTESSALEVTQRFRDYGWKETSRWLIVSIDLCGNPVGLDAKGRIWRLDHDLRSTRMLAESFEEYLRKWCLVG